MPYIFSALVLMLVAVYVVDKIITRKSTNKSTKEKDKYDFEEEDCYNGRYDRNSKRFRD